MSTFELYQTKPKNFVTNPEDAGRRKSNGGNSWQLKSLWDRHHVMKRLCVLGWSVKAIAEHLGMTSEAVRACLNSEIMIRELEVFRAGLDLKTADVAKRLEEMASKSCDVLDEILENDNAPIAIRAKVALDVLSRTGHPPHTRISGQIDHRHFTESEIERLKAQAKMEQIESSVDAEFTETTVFTN